VASSHQRGLRIKPHLRSQSAGRADDLSGPGQFDIVHDVWVAEDGRVFVADRQNHRIQIFTPDGECITEWTGFRQPCSVYIDDATRFTQDGLFVGSVFTRVFI